MAEACDSDLAGGSVAGNEPEPLRVGVLDGVPVGNSVAMSEENAWGGRRGGGYDNILCNFFPDLEVWEH